MDDDDAAGGGHASDDELERVLWDGTQASYHARCFDVPEPVDVARALPGLRLLEDETAVQQLLYTYRDRFNEVQHHVRSYELFMDEMLPSIIREKPPIFVDADRTGRTHELTLGRVVSYTTPCVTETNNATREVTPDECRTRRMTYACNVLISVAHVTYADLWVDKSAPPPPVLRRQDYHNVTLLRMPVMIGSRYAHPSTHPQECGGYFLQNGVEKLLIPQERAKYNAGFVSHVKQPNRYRLVCEVRSAHRHKIRSTSTIKMYMAVGGGAYDRALEAFIAIPFMTGMDVPLAAVMHALGDGSREGLRAALLAVSGEALRGTPAYMAAVDAFVGAAKSEEYTRRPLPELYAWIAAQAIKDKREATGERKAKHVQHLLAYELLPHIGHVNDPATCVAKRLYLAYIVHRLILVHLELVPADNRDGGEHKRFDLAGTLLALLVRQLYGAWTKKLALSVYTSADHSLTPSLDFLWRNKLVTNELAQAIQTGNWSLTKGPATRGGNNSMTGISQVVNRLSAQATLSHMRRVDTPLNRDGKETKPRQLDQNHRGRLCPAETPEGNPCGLVKQLAIGTYIRLGSPSEPLLRLCARLGVRPLAAPAVADQGAAGDCLVFVNGIPAGTHASGRALAAELRALRRSLSGLLPWDASVSHVGHVVAVTTDAGNALRPLVVLAHVHRLPGVLAGGAGPDLWHRLLLAGVVEFVDTVEEETLRVALTPAEARADVGPGGFPFTHMEVSPVLWLGIGTALIPFPERNQSPRNTYQAGMGKQSMPKMTSLNTAENARVDAHAHFLWYGETPLVHTWVQNMYPMLQGIDNGQNFIVALICSGTNQDDSVRLNKTTLDLGGMRSSTVRVYREEARQAGNEVGRFEKPDRNECHGMRDANYDTLDVATGLALPGTRILRGDAIIGKTVRAKSQDPLANRRETVKYNQSTVANADEEAYVDSIVRSRTKDNDEQIQVRTRTMHVPRVGDKFSSRHGQKGVCGQIVPAEDMILFTGGPFAGLNPDIEVNAHAFPSRMTIAHIAEMLFGTLCATTGQFGDATAFRPVTIEDIMRALDATGCPGDCTFPALDGRTGAMLQVPVFAGICFYQRLKHLVAEKKHCRGAFGRVHIVTRQPTEGRVREGGLRFGEMERDCLISYGASKLIQDRLFYASDYYKTVVCAKCGLLAIPARESQTVLENGPFCMNCGTGAHVVLVQLPFAAKLNLQEMMAGGIAPRLRIDPLAFNGLAEAERARQNYWSRDRAEIHLAA